MSTPTPPSQAQASASSTNPSPRKQRNAATARGVKANAAGQLQSADEVYLNVLEQYEQNSVALICCVNTYPLAKEGQIKLKDLSCALADGKKLAAMLRAQGFQVVVLLDQDVTKENINRQLGEIIRKFQKAVQRHFRSLLVRGTYMSHPPGYMTLFLMNILRWVSFLFE